MRCMSHCDCSSKIWPQEVYDLSLCLTIASAHADNNGGYGSNNSELPLLI